MNGQIITRRLQGNAPFDYLLEVLETGGVGDEAFAKRELSEGVVSAVVPSTADESRVMRFSEGGLLPAEPPQAMGGMLVQEVPTTIPQIAQVVAQRLRSLTDPVIWVNEALLSEDEVNSRKLKCRMVDGQLYLVYEGGVRTKKRIEEVINYSMLSWHFLAFVTDGLREASFVRELVGQARMILAGAYDGESALIWERDLSAR
jgi:hypothetical protein